MVVAQAFNPNTQETEVDDLSPLQRAHSSTARAKETLYREKEKQNKKAPFSLQVEF